MFDNINSGQVQDIMKSISSVTCLEAESILDAIGCEERFYVKSQSVNVHSMLNDVKNLSYLASFVKPVTFKGSPTQKKWYTLSLQELVEDKVMEAISLYGTRLIKDTIDEAFNILYYGHRK